MFEVVYYPMCGARICEGIKKVAEAIASELGVTADDMQNKKELTQDSFVFLGSGCSTVKDWGELLGFITSNDFEGRRVALFGTSGSGKGVEVRLAEELLKPKGALIAGSFYCKGHRSLLLRDHPNDEELASARDFASEMRKPG